MVVEIYTDGACSGNPGPGGWGCILMQGKIKKELSGFSANTTNNIMELTAVIKALEALNKPCKVNLYSDSSYVVNAFLQDWVGKWQKNNWKGSAGPVKNKEIWERLIALTQKNEVQFIKVKGHSDNEFNNRCDELARTEIEKNK